MAKPKKSRTGSGSRARSTGYGELRIIGGQWRGRKLRFPEEEGLRPTGDRIRETLFNWLAPHIQEANCLDLYAGSGALGLEALSRGARQCDFVDTSRNAIQQILSHLDSLQASERGQGQRLAALEFLQGTPTPYDVVFIDPPFGQGMVEAVCGALDAANWLAPEALVYLEVARDEPLPPLPPHWEMQREKTSGAVTYRLYLTGTAR